MESFGHAPALDMFRVPNSETEGNPLVAPADGVVNQSYSDPDGGGNIIQINHGGGWFTTGIHLQSRAVQVGDRVEQGQPIGRVGHTGETSNDVSHLHFEQAIDKNGDGQAEWGKPNPERVVQVFDGVEYGQENGQTFSVTSRNCDGQEPSQDPSMSGRAFGLTGQAGLPGLPVSLGPTPDTGEVKTTEEKTVAPACAETVSAPTLSASTLCAMVRAQTEPSTVTATASLASASISLPGLPVLKVSGPTASSTSTCEKSSGSVELALTVAGTPVEVGDVPNEEVDLGVAGTRLVVNEQAKTDGGLRVTALHLTAPGDVDIVLASAATAIRDCAA
jgi:hypothetical protein